MLSAPRDYAQKILNKVWANKPFPVDPVTISKILGLNVLETELPPNVSGALIKERGKEPTIVLHRHDHNNRKRFSCAHELGHYISRIESNDTAKEYEYVDLRGALSSTGTDRDEIFANQFSAHLLMPNEIVRKLIKKNKSHFETALFFGVSVEALKPKLNSLGLL